MRKSSTWELAGEFPRPHPDLLSETLVAEAGSTPEVGASPRGGHGNPPQYSCLGTALDGGALQARRVGGTESDATERLRSHSWCLTSPLSESDACSDCKPLMWEDAEGMWKSDQLTRLQKH